MTDSQSASALFDLRRTETRPRRAGSAVGPVRFLLATDVQRRSENGRRGRRATVVRSRDEPPPDVGCGDVIGDVIDDVARKSTVVVYDTTCAVYSCSAAVLDAEGPRDAAAAAAWLRHFVIIDTADPCNVNVNQYF